MTKRKLSDPSMGVNSGKLSLCWSTLQNLQAPLLLRLSFPNNCRCFKLSHPKVCCKCLGGQTVTWNFFSIFDVSLLSNVPWLKDKALPETNMQKQCFECEVWFPWQSTNWKILIDLSRKASCSSTLIIQVQLHQSLFGFRSIKPTFPCCVKCSLCFGDENILGEFRCYCFTLFFSLQPRMGNSHVKDYSEFTSNNDQQHCQISPEMSFSCQFLIS